MPPLPRDKGPQLWPTLALTLCTVAASHVSTAKAGNPEWFESVAFAPGDPCTLVAKYENSDGGFLYSADGGRSFRLRPSSTLAPEVAYDDDFLFAVTGDGTTLVGDFRGLTQDAADGCTWTLAEDPLVTPRVSGFARHPSDPSIHYLVTTSGQPGERTGIVRREADGRFTAVGESDTGPDGQRFWPNRLIAVAVEGATDGVRFYESGLRAGEGDAPGMPALRYSDDAGATWTEHPQADVDLAQTLRLWLVDPEDPDHVLVTVRDERAEQEGELDAVLVSDDGGATYRPWITEEVSHVSAVTRAPDGTVYLGDAGYSKFYMPPQGLWRGRLDEAPAKIADYGIRCLAARPQDGALFGCRRETEFGRIDSESGEFRPTFTLEHTESYLECPGEDLVQRAKGQVCDGGDGWCTSAHHPFSLFCQAYDEPNCGPASGLSFSGDEPKVIEPLDHVVDPLCSHARDAETEAEEQADAGAAEPDPKAGASPDAGGETDTPPDSSADRAENAGDGPSFDPSDNGRGTDAATSAGGCGGCETAPSRGDALAWLALAGLALLRRRHGTVARAR